MKCHYKLCQNDALDTWPYSRSEVPLCEEHADWMTEAVPLPDVRAEDIHAEQDRLIANILAAMQHIRNDCEWSEQAYERRPELN